MGFDIVLTMAADTLYAMLAQKIRRHEHCDASKIYRNFIRGSGTVTVTKNEIVVRMRKCANNTILRDVARNELPTTVLWLDTIKLSFKFDYNDG